MHTYKTKHMPLNVSVKISVFYLSETAEGLQYLKD